MEEEVKKLKDNLNELIKYVNDFFNFLPIPVSDLSPNFYIIQANKAFEKLTGFDLLEIVGEPIGKIFPEKEKLENVFSLLSRQNVLENEELLLITKSGKEKIISSFWAKRREGNELRGFFLAIIDITLEKKIKQEMEEAIKKHTAELNEKIEEMEKFQKIAVGRELKMVELKKEIENLKIELEILKRRKK